MPFIYIILVIIIIYYLKLENIFLLLNNKNWLKLIKEKRYFYYQKLRHTKASFSKIIIRIVIISKIS